MEGADDGEAAKVELSLLGEPRASGPSGRQVALEKHDAAMLALLALLGPQARPRVAGLLWPDTEAAAASTALRQRLFRLRKALGHPLVSDKGPLQLLSSVTHDLVPERLHDGALALDLVGAHHYSEGDALGEQVGALRELWRLRLVEAFEQRAEAFERAGSLDEATAVAERIAIALPTSDAAHRRCMRLHYLRGDRSRALDAFERYRERLRRTVGVEPDEETLELAALVASATLPVPMVSTTARQLPVALARPPRLVGRRRPWEAFAAAWARGALIVVRGEAGIGKSRLAVDFAQAHGDPIVLKVHAGDTALPFVLLARLLRRIGPPSANMAPWVRAELARIVPEWGAPAEGNLHTQRLHQALIEAWASLAEPARPALVIDDVQWADQASLEVMLPWLSQAASRPLTLIALRDAEAPDCIREWLASQWAPATLDWPLLPLDLDGVGELLASLQLSGIPADELPLAADRLLHLTGGHPFVLLELLRSSPQANWARASAGDAQGSTPLEALLRQRLARLEPAALRLVRLAALCGHPLQAPLAARVLGCHELDLVDDWRSVQEAQLMQEDGALYDLVRDAALSAIPVAVAVAMHERFAAALTQQQAAPERIAAHWEGCHRFADAAACHGQAAALARAGARQVDELSSWDHAARCFAAAGDARACWQARHQGVAVAMLVEPWQRLEPRISGLLADAADERERLDALLIQARALLGNAIGTAALAPAAEALALARTLRDDPARSVRAAGWYGLALAMGSRLSDSLALLEGEEPVAHRVSDARAQLDFFGSLGYALHLAGRYGDASRALLKAVEFGELVGDLAETAEQLGNVSTCHHSLGNRPAAIAFGERALALWQRIGQPDSVSAAALRCQLAPAYFGDGRFTEALDMLDHARRCFSTSGPVAWLTITEHRLAQVFLRLGQPARARQALTPLEEEADPGRRSMRVMVECRIDAYAGKSGLARLQRAVADWGDRLAPMDRRALLLQVAGQSPADEARRLAGEVLADAEARGDRPAALHALARLALACMGTGDGPAAARAARQAWSMADDTLPLDLDHPSLCWWIHLSSAFGGEEGLAAQALDSGVQWLLRARPHVPGSFQRSFFDRNPVHRDLLAANGHRRHRDSSA